jgi:UDP-glucose 4-epimerase
VKVLITGSEGFLGKWLQKKAGAHTVVPFDASITTAHDVRSYGAVAQAMHGADAVIHAAAIADLNYSAANPGLNYGVNVAGTEVVASEAAKRNIPVLFISTCCVYGNEQPAGLSTVPVPTELYAWSKLAGEAIVKGYSNANQIARIPTLYGPGMRPALFIYRAIDAIAKGEPVTLHGDGRQTRQYGYAEDVASLVWWQLETQKPLMNLNPRERTSCIDVCAQAAGLMEKPLHLQFGPDRPGQIVAQNILSTTNTFHRAFIEGLADTIEWYNGAKHT